MSNKVPQIIKVLPAILVIVLIGGYIIFNTRIFIKGPQLSISTPQNGLVMDEKLTHIKGETHNTSFISINDRAISVDEKGNFNSPILLHEGNNYIVIKANDRFDRQVTETLNLVYNISEDI